MSKTEVIPEATTSTKKRKLQENFSGKMKKIDIEKEQENEFSIVPILSDEYSNPVETELMYAGKIFMKKETSRLIKEISVIWPLEDKSHLKRVRWTEQKGVSEILIRPVRNGELVECSELVSLKKVLDAICIDTTGLMDSALVYEVPKYPALTYKQYKVSSKLWPVQFRENKYIEKVLSGKLFTCEDQKKMESFMRRCISVAAHGDVKVGCLVVEPSSSKIIAIAHDCRHLHPLQHAVMVAIDLVAKSQGGGCWDIESKHLYNLPFEKDEHERKIAEIKKKNPDKDAYKMCTPYLCTGYDLYVTREPCILCAMALVHSRIRRVFYGHKTECGALGTREKIHLLQGLNHHYEVWSDLLKNECLALGDSKKFSEPWVPAPHPAIAALNILKKYKDFLPPAKVLAGKEESTGIMKYSHQNCDSISKDCTSTDGMKIPRFFDSQKYEEAKIDRGFDLEKLSSDIHSLYKSGYLSDVHIRAGEKVFKVHKIILYARCPALLKDLKQDVSGTSAVVDSISSDIEPPILKALLSYLYSGKLNIKSASLLAGLCLALEYYELNSLKKLICFTPKPSTDGCFTPKPSDLQTQTLFIWPIKNFSSLKPEQKVFSPIATFGDEIFQLALMLSEDSNDIKIYLHRVSEVIDKELRAKCFIKVFTEENVDGNFSKEDQISLQYLEYKDNREALSNVLNKKLLYYYSDKTLPNDTLTLQCQIVVYMIPNEPFPIKFPNTFFTGKSYPREIRDLSKLSEDLDSIFYKMVLKKAKFSDIELCLKNKKLYAHKAILFSRSPECFTMTSSGSGDQAVYELDLKNDDPSAVFSVLHYIYTGKFPYYDHGNATAIYILASKMKLFTLQNQCLAQLKSCLQVKDAVKILKLADSFNDLNLKACAQEFILEHPREILCTNEWMSLLKENPDLINEMYVHMADKFKKLILADDPQK